MTSNASVIRLSSSIDVSTVFGFFLLSVSISIFLSFIIIFLILTTKTLFSPSNLLIGNTCVTTVFYLIISIVKILIFYKEFVVSDTSCRIQAYLCYVFLTLLMYSYVIQAISRLFFTILYKHRYLLNYKCHFILIICQIIVSFLIPLPSIITQDIRYRPLKMCLIPMTNVLHVFYLHTLVFFIPFVVIVIIYIVILRRAIRSSLIVHQSWHRIRRDVELVRNILIIFTILLFCQLPSIIYIALSLRMIPTSKAFYMFAVAASPISTAIEKMSVIILNKDIRKEINKRWKKLYHALRLNSNRIQPAILSKTVIEK